MTHRSPLAWLAARERALWSGGVLLYGVGDAVTTLWGLSMAGVGEAGPVAAPVIEATGPPAILAVKIATLALFFAAWRVLHAPARTAVPLALIVVGTLVTAWNLAVIISVTG